MKRNDIPENIGEYVKYDETSRTGLRWIKLFGNGGNVSVGTETGCLNSRDYYNFEFNYNSYLNHRVIFFLHNGYCPDVVDHSDGHKQNNKIENLRKCTQSQNCHNQKIRKNNSSGVKGISTHGNQWKLKITLNYKEHIQYLNKREYTLEQAKEIIELARAKLHGNFTNHG